MVYFHGTAAVMSENDLVIDVADVYNKALQLINGALALSLFAHHCNVSLKRIFKILQCLPDTCQHYQRCGAL